MCSPSVVVMKRMAIGCVLINVQPGTEQQVYNDVRNLPHVADATVLFGDHDLIVKVAAEKSIKLREAKDDGGIDRNHKRYKAMKTMVRTYPVKSNSERRHHFFPLKFFCFSTIFLFSMTFNLLFLHFLFPYVFLCLFFLHVYFSFPAWPRSASSSSTTCT